MNLKEGEAVLFQIDCADPAIVDNAIYTTLLKDKRYAWTHQFEKIKRYLKER